MKRVNYTIKAHICSIQSSDSVILYSKLNNQMNVKTHVASKGHNPCQYTILYMTSVKFHV